MNVDLHPIRLFDYCAGSGMLGLGVHLALETLGVESRTILYLEREAYAAATLVERMEEEALDRAPIWDDAGTFRGIYWRGRVDCIVAGYPCQPFSFAGKRLGSKDERHIWPHLRRSIEEIEPGIVFLENVPGHVHLGFRAVRRDLEGLGYTVKPGLFTASEVGKSHLRKRLFVLAYTESVRGQGHQRVQSHRNDGPVEHSPPRRRVQVWAESAGIEGRLAPDLASAALAISPRIGGGESNNTAGPLTRNNPWSTVSSGSYGVRILADAIIERSQERFHIGGDYAEELATPERTGIPLFAPPPGDPVWDSILKTDPDLEPAICRVAHGVASRVDRLRLTGNGVCPLQAAYAFLSLLACVGE